VAPQFSRLRLCPTLLTDVPREVLSHRSSHWSSHYRYRQSLLRKRTTDVLDRPLTSAFAGGDVHRFAHVRRITEWRKILRANDQATMTS
jgi:hypothetical protein